MKLQSTSFQLLFDVNIATVQVEFQMDVTDKLNDMGMSNTFPHIPLIDFYFFYFYFLFTYLVSDIKGGT
jgi:hypothetical protein